jgi:hypothetical protein
MYDFVASSNVLKAGLAYSQGPLSQNLSAKISGLTTSRCSILWTIRKNAFVDHRGLPLQVAMNWSWSSLHTPAAYYIVSWLRSTSIWSYSHQITCCFLLLLRTVLSTVCECKFWDIFSVAAIAASWRTNWCLCRCCVSARGSFNEAPVVGLNSDSNTLGCGVCGAMSGCCGKGEEDDNEKWKVLKNT